MELDKLNEIIANEKGVMLYFWGENCAVCDALKPKITELFTTKFPKIKQFIINAQENPDIAAAFSVFSIPTTIVFLEGKEFVREGRALSIYELEQKVARFYNLLFEEA